MFSMTRQWCNLLTYRPLGEVCSLSHDNEDYFRNLNDLREDLLKCFYGS